MRNRKTEWIVDKLNELTKTIGLVQTRINEMDSRIQAIADAEVALETVVDAVVADHTALVDRLNAAVAANDWTGVEDVSTHLSAITEKLKAIAPAS